MIRENNGCGEDNAGADGPHDGRGLIKTEKCTVPQDFMKNLKVTQDYLILVFSKFRILCVKVLLAELKAREPAEEDILRFKMRHIDNQG